MTNYHHNATTLMLEYECERLKADLQILVLVEEEHEANYFCTLRRLRQEKALRMKQYRQAQARLATLNTNQV